MRSTILIASLALVACQQANTPSGPHPAFNGIGETQAVHFTGTEPFWGGSIARGTVHYTNPDMPDGTDFAFTRFAGLNGVSFSGQMQDKGFDLMITPGTCSDGMSDRKYPYTATLRLGTETREGCAWTDAKPSTGGEAK